MEEVQKMLDRFGSDLSKYPILVKAEEKTNCPKQYLVLSVASGLLICLSTGFGASLMRWIGCLLLSSLLWNMSLGLLNLARRDLVKPLRLALLNKGLLRVKVEGLPARLLGKLLDTLLVEGLVLLVELMLLVMLVLVLLLLLLVVVLMWLGPMRLNRLLGRE